jgi:hypothetical protein
MNELEQIVQSMIDSGQPEENINAVIAEYQSQQEGKTNATAKETALVVAETPADTDLQLEDGSLELQGNQQGPSQFAEEQKQPIPFLPSYEEKNNIKVEPTNAVEVFKNTQEQLKDIKLSDFSNPSKLLAKATQNDDFVTSFSQNVFDLEKDKIEGFKTELSKKYDLSNADGVNKANKELDAFTTNMLKEAMEGSNGYKTRLNAYTDALVQKQIELINSTELKAEKENEAQVKALADFAFRNVPFLPDSVKKGGLRLMYTVPQAVDLGIPVTGALSKLDDAASLGEILKRIETRGGVPSKKGDGVFVTNISGGSDKYESNEAAIKDYQNKIQELYSEGLGKIVESQQYQEMIDKFGAPPEVWDEDGLTGKDFGEMFGTQAGQMVMSILPPLIYAQEAGGMLTEVLEGKGQEKFGEKWGAMSQEDKNKAYEDIVKSGEIDYTKIELSGGISASLDVFSNLFGASKIAKGVGGSVARNLLKRNFKGVVKASRGNLKEIVKAQLAEIPTEIMQETITGTTVGGELGTIGITGKELLEVGTQAAITSGPLVAIGRGTKGTIRQARKLAGLEFKSKKEITNQIKQEVAAVEMLYENGSIDKAARDEQLTAIYEAESIARNSKYKNFETEAKEDMVDLEIQKKILTNKNESLKTEYTAENVFSAGQIAANEEEIQKLEEKRKNVLNKQITLNMGNKFRDYINNNSEKFNGFTYSSFETADQAKDFLIRKGVDLNKENVQGLINGDNYAITLDGQKIIVDVKENLKLGKSGVGGNAVHHEGIHAILNSSDDATVQSIVDGIKQFAKESGNKDLLSIVNDSELRVSTDYSTAKSREANEEFLASVSDFMRVQEVEAGDVQVTTALSKIGNRIAQALGKGNPESLDFSGLKDGAETIAFLRKYNSFNGNPLSNIKLPTPKKGSTDVETSEKSIDKNSASKIVQEVKFEEDSINEQFKAFTHDGKKNNAPESFHAQAAYAYEPLARSVVERISKIGFGISKKQDQFIIDYFSNKENKDAFVSDLTFGPDNNKASSLVGIAKRYNPAIGSFGGHASKYLALQAIRVFEERASRQVTQGAQTLDAPESMQVAGEGQQIDTTDTRSTSEKLGFNNAIKNEAERVVKQAVQDASNKLSGKDISDKKKANLKKKSSDKFIEDRILPLVKKAIGKNTKNEKAFTNFVSKVDEEGNNSNFEVLRDLFLDQIDVQKGSGPAALWNIDNPPSLEEFLDYYEGSGTTKSDRRSSLARAVSRSIASEARLEFAKKDPATAKLFKEKHGVVLASKIVLPNNKSLQTLAGIAGFKDGAGMPASKVWEAFGAETNIGFNLSKKEGRERAIKAMEFALTKGNVPLDAFATGGLMINSSPRFFKDQETAYEKAKEEYRKNPTAKNKKLKEEANKVRLKVKNDFTVDMDKMIDRIKKESKATYLTGAAKGWTKSKFSFNKNGTSIEKILESFKNGTTAENNKANLAMFEQTMQPLYDLVSKDSKMVNLVMMLTNTSNGGSNLWFRQGAEVVGSSSFLLPGKEGERGIEWEHAMQANNARLFLLNSAINKVPWGTVYPAVKRNYKVIALDKSLDDILKASKRGNAMGLGWDVYTGHWTERYFHPDVFAVGGIDPSTIVDINGQTLADKYKIDSAGKSVKVMASKILDTDFNKMLERVKGVKAEARYSEDRANKLAGNKGKFKFFVPYSAEDYVGLIYPTLGKGKEGDRNLQWYKDNIINPFAVGIANFEKAKVESLEQWRDLKKQIGKTPAKLNKEAVRGFTNEEALRVYLWNEQDVVPDTLAKKDVEALVKHVEDSKDLSAFVENVKSIVGVEGYPAPGNNWLSGSLTIDLIDNINTGKRSEFLQQWQDNVDVVYSKDNMNKLKAIYGERYTEALENILYRMKTGRNRPSGATRLENQFMNWVNDSVGTVMFFNTRSALLQTISAVNFLNWSDNNPLMAAKAFANQPRFWKDFADLFNSDFLKSRRSGLKNDINADELAKSAATSDNKVRAGLSALLKAGFLPTQIADSFAISIGGASFYRNRLNTYKKQGLSEEQAKEKAMLDFQETAEESQQSSRPDRVSMQQASSLGRVILAFANTPMQYTRLTKKAALDLVNGRGDWKTNMSKILYYGAVQNIIFTALQQAMFAMLFDDDELDDEEQTEASTKIVNGIADTFLRGSGVGGAAVATMKNIIMEIIKQKESKRPDYTKAALKLTTLSPPIDTKIRKLMSAGRAFTYRQSLKDMNRLGVDIDNPAALATGQVLSAVANLPADRAILKMRNVKDALDTEHEAWQRIALGLGFSDWQLGIDKDKSKGIKSKAQQMKELKEKDPRAYKRLKAKERREKKKGKRLKKSPTKKLERGVAGRANNDGTIEIDPNLSPVEREKTIAHEEQHMKDMKAGKLDYDDNYVYWNGGKHERKNGKIKYKGKSYIEGHKDLPWEKKAYAAEPSTAEAKKRTKLYA